MKPFIGKTKKTPKSKKRKTLKKRTVNLNKASIYYYANYYKNTQLIPKTQIINYLLNHFKPFLEYKSICDKSNNIPLHLDECFQINPSYFPEGLRKNKIELSLQMNSKTPLDKLIAYCFYIKQPTIFEQNHVLTDLKYQIGKDIVRDVRTINGVLRDQQYYFSNTFNNYEIADLFYKNIINEMQHFTRQIDINLVNKLALLSCQNVYGLITDLITMQINDMLKPELNSVFRPSKSADIVIKKDQMSIEYYLKTKMLITRDGGSFDPEYPCGNMEVSLFIDILNNIYEIKQLIFEYDIDKCGPEQVDNSGNKINKSKFKSEYILPATAITAGIVSAPFLLPLLGGKKIRKYRNKNKK